MEQALTSPGRPLAKAQLTEAPGQVWMAYITALPGSPGYLPFRVLCGSSGLLFPYGPPIRTASGTYSPPHTAGLCSVPWPRPPPSQHLGQLSGLSLEPYSPPSSDSVSGRMRATARTAQGEAEGQGIAQGYAPVSDREKVTSSDPRMMWLL